MSFISQLLHASLGKNWPLVMQILHDPLCTTEIRTVFFPYAIENGRLEIVDLLLLDPNVDPAVQDNIAICRASVLGDSEMVSRLMQDSRVNPAVDEWPLRAACEKGHISIIEQLLQDPRVDPRAPIDRPPLSIACSAGQLQVVKLFVKEKGLDPSANGNHAIMCAKFRHHCHVIDWLLLDPRIDSMSSEMPQFDKIQMIRLRSAEICIGLQDLQFPALVTLEILDALIPNSVPMYKKWNLICKVKHFCA